MTSVFVVFGATFGTSCRSEGTAPPSTAPMADPNVGVASARAAAPYAPSSPGMPAPPGCGKPAKSGASTLHVQAAGKDRSYTLVVPNGYAPGTQYPLVFALHGSGGTGAGARNQFGELERAADGHAVFVYPDAIRGSWDLNDPAESNTDVALFDAILLATHNSLCVDPNRTFVTGFSNGAYMANQLGCRRGERIRGIVSHAGGGPYEMKGSFDSTGHLVCPGKSVAALVVHGTADGTVAPSEGQKSIDHWTYANRCSEGTAPGLQQPCVTVNGCFQPVAYCKVPNLGHAVWKDGGRVTWNFFENLK